MNILQKLNEEQRKSFEEIKSSTGYEAILNIANEILDDECKLEDVDDNLPAEEYKTEMLARKKATIMFWRVFQNIDNLSKNINLSKINYE